MKGEGGRMRSGKCSPASLSLSIKTRCPHPLPFPRLLGKGVQRILLFPSLVNGGGTKGGGSRDK